ncbi:hypothetical protein C0585_01175, partial [Candidatus Woesearchaeota archaeon]
SKIWIALLSRVVSTAGELSDIANVPRSRSYDVLESLEKKGFVVMKLGKPIKYIAVSPSEVVERVKKKIKEDMVERTNMIEEINGSEVLNELNLLYTQGVEMVEATDLTASLKGRDNIYDHFQLMFSSATESIQIMTTEEGLIKKAPFLKKAFEKLKNRDVKIQILAPINQKHDNVLDELSKYAEIKNTKKVNSRFMIVDNKELLFMLLPDTEVHPSYDVGVWVNTPFFAQSISDMFNVIFEMAEENSLKN